jgi:hypothetical protein
MSMSLDSYIPVLFGGGRRLFEVLPSRVELEIIRVIDTPEATHIRYRVFRTRPFSGSASRHGTSVSAGVWKSPRPR